MTGLREHGHRGLDSFAAVRLLQRIAVVANEAPSFTDAIQSALDEVCCATGWPVGHAYLPEHAGSDRLAPSAIWHLGDPERFQTFRRVTEATPLRFGAGLPGRILASGKPAWIVDVSIDPNFPRNTVAGDLGVRGGFGFPVLASRRIVAVLEFFSESAEQPDDALLDVVAHVGTQLGRVAERETAAASLVAQVEHTRLLINSAYDAFVSIGSDGVITGWNESAEKMFGWPHFEAVGRSLAETIVPPQHRDAHTAGISHFLATGEGPVLNKRLELTAVHRNGTEFAIELAVWPVASDGGYTFCAFIRDISERKRTEQALHQMVEKLRELDQARTIFVSSVSHELRTPLTNIIGYLELVLEANQSLGESDRDLLAIADRNSRRLLALTEDLLTFSRLHAEGVHPLMERVHIATLLDAVRSVIAPAAAARSLEVSFEVDDRLDQMHGDADQLERLFINLLSNAIKFTPAGGTVKLCAARGDHSLVVKIEDSGIGVPADEIPRLFSPFFRSSNAQREAVPGTGLGLAIVKAIVEQHDGAIDVVSADGKGTIVTVEVPEGGG